MIANKNSTHASKKKKAAGQGRYAMNLQVETNPSNTGITLYSPSKVFVFHRLNNKSVIIGPARHTASYTWLFVLFFAWLAASAVAQMAAAAARRYSLVFSHEILYVAMIPTFFLLFTRALRTRLVIDESHIRYRTTFLGLAIDVGHEILAAQVAAICTKFGGFPPAAVDLVLNNGSTVTWVVERALYSADIQWLADLLNRETERLWPPHTERAAKAGKAET